MATTHIIMACPYSRRERRAIMAWPYSRRERRAASSGDRRVRPERSLRRSICALSGGPARLYLERRIATGAELQRERKESWEDGRGAMAKERGRRKTIRRNKTGREEYAEATRPGRVRLRRMGIRAARRRASARRLVHQAGGREAHL